jgi:hypothetical protein
VEIVTLGYASEDVTDDERWAAGGARHRGSGSGVHSRFRRLHRAPTRTSSRARTASRCKSRREPPDDDKHHSVLRAHARLLTGGLIAIDEETDLAVIKVEAKGLPTLDFA